MLVPLLILLSAGQTEGATSRPLLPDPPVYSLGAPSAKEVQKAREEAARIGAALAGIHRNLKNVSKRGEWRMLANKGPWIWRLKVVSTRAASLRLHSVAAHPAIRLQAPGETTTTEWTGEWSALVFGDTALLTYEPADGKKSKRLPFTVDKLSHQIR